MPSEPDHLLFRRYLVARERGDLTLAEQVWERLAVNNFDRVKQIVKGFQFSPGRKLPEPEWGSAASEAYLRLVAMGKNFRESLLAQYYAALYRCVHNACFDYGRKELRHKKHSAGSIDQTFEPDGEAGPFDKALAKYDAERREEAQDAEDTADNAEAAHQLVAWAISQVKNDNYREVLEMTYLQKLPAEEIAAQLGISLENAYQRRSRGVKELEKILRDFRS